MATMSSASDHAVTALCDTVMRGVVNVLGERVRGHEDVACSIMRANLKAAITGGTDLYRDARQSVVEGALSSGWFTSLIVTECVSQILESLNA